MYSNFNYVFFSSLNFSFRRTSYVVRASSSDEKNLFRNQEEDRFASPHRAYTYSLHGYESVVGPVKGVYTKDNAMNKAREHALLISERPAYVTILTLGKIVMSYPY